MDLLEAISIPFPALGISTHPRHAGFFLGADAALKNSVLKKLYPCKCLLIRVSSSVLVPPLTAGTEQAPSSHFHLSLGTLWKQHLEQDLSWAGEEMLTWPGSILQGCSHLVLAVPHSQPSFAPAQVSWYQVTCPPCESRAPSLLRRCQGCR